MPFQQFKPIRSGVRMGNTKPMLKFAKNGVITVNRLAYRLLKEPEHVVIHLDLDAGLLGLQAVDEGHPDSVRMHKSTSGGAEASIKALYRLVEDRYTGPMSAVARFYGDTILAAPVLPLAKAVPGQNGRVATLQKA